MVSRLFNLVQGLVALAVGLYCAGLGDMTTLGIEAQGAGLVEAQTAIGGTWIFLGLLFLAGANPHRARSTLAYIAVAYAVLAGVRIVAIQQHAAESLTLMFLLYEILSAVIAGVLFKHQDPDRRRIFGS